MRLLTQTKIARTIHNDVRAIRDGRDVYRSSKSDFVHRFNSPRRNLFVDAINECSSALSRYISCCDTIKAVKVHVFSISDMHCNDYL